MKFELPPQIFEKHSNIKFHEVPFSGSRSVPYERTYTKLEAGFRNFANVLKKEVWKVRGGMKQW
jgi:hypothetical protein